MNNFETLSPNPSLRGYRRAVSIVILLLAVVSASLHAQTASRIGNQDIAAHVITSPKTGRFWITGGSDYGDSLKFLYASGPSFVTSNIVFRVTRGGVTSYYCNLPSNESPASKPLDPVTHLPIPYVPFDSSYVSADTIALVYRNLAGFYVTLRFMPEKRRTIYDRGSDMLMEFEYIDTFGFQPGELGILMMLDTYNNNATSNSGGGTGDNASTLTDKGYYPSGGFGASFTQSMAGFPSWYEVGNFTMSRPLNTLLPVHRLVDTSHGGRRLTPPSVMAIGSWIDFRSVGWDIPATVGSTIYNDAATIVRWDALQGTGKVVTAFGLGDRAGNDMFTCRDSTLFVNIRTVRLVQQRTIGGSYSPSKFDITMWVTNTSQSAQNVSIDMITPISTIPLTAGRLMLDAGSPHAVALQLLPNATKQIDWTLKATPGAADSPDTIDAVLQFNYFYGTGNSLIFRQACSPTITLIDKRKAVPPVERDTMPPIISLAGSGNDPNSYPYVYWDFEARDRHPGYHHDSGIDTIIIDRARTSNIYLMQSSGWRCDTLTTYRPRFAVIDFRRSGSLYFTVRDCSGNTTTDSVIYTAPSDTMPPVLVRTAHAITPDIYWTFDAFDRHAGYRYDSGIDRVVVDQTRSSNIGLAMEGVTRCDTLGTLKPRFSVIDPRLSGIVYFDLYDCAGNIHSDSIIYSNDPTVGVRLDRESPAGALLIESIAPNPVRGTEVLVTMRGAIPGSTGATLVTVDGHEIPCTVVGVTGRTLRIALPESLAGGQYLLRISSGHRSDALPLRYVRP